MLTRLDPCDLCFRDAPGADGDTLHEIDSLELEHGELRSTAPCVVFTAFHCDMKPCAKPATDNLVIPGEKKKPSL